MKSLVVFSALIIAISIIVLTYRHKIETGYKIHVDTIKDQSDFVLDKAVYRCSKVYEERMD